MALILDQLGLNARTVDDIILVDAAVNGYDPASVNGKHISELRIGVPRYPFVEAYIPAGGDNPFDYAEAGYSKSQGKTLWSSMGKYG